MGLGSGNVIRYDMKDINPLIIMYCVRNGMTDADFCKRLGMSPVTLRNWRRRGSIPVQMVHKLKKILDINFMDLHAVNTDGIE